MLLEEDYKDLSTHLFNAQFGLLDDFQNSESDQELSDHELVKQDKSRDRNVKSASEKTYSYENEANKPNVATSERYEKKDEDYMENNIYDDDQDDNIQDR